MGEILAFLRERIAWARAAGVAENRMIVDPGIGFGKSVERDNFTILRNLGELRCLGRPLLVGPSRKAFLGALRNLPVEEREEATAAAVAAAVMHGANIVRVHEVKKMKRVVEVAQAIRDAASRQG
jgi:dihydropteroate synthase